MAGRCYCDSLPLRDVWGLKLSRREGTWHYTRSSSLSSPTSRPSSTYLPARSSSRANPSALSQRPNVIQATCSGQIPSQVQTPNSQQASRSLVDERTPRGLGNTLPLPQPTNQFGTQRPLVQRTQALSQSGNTQRLASEVAQLSLSDARPNLVQHGSHQTSLTPRTSGYQAVPVNLGMETPSHSRGELTVLGPSQQNVYPYPNAYVDSPSFHPVQVRTPPFQPNYAGQQFGNRPTPSRSYMMSPNYNPSAGPGPSRTFTSPYPQPHSIPNPNPQLVAPGMTLPNQPADYGNQTGQGRSLVHSRSIQN